MSLFPHPAVLADVREPHHFLPFPPLASFCNRMQTRQAGPLATIRISGHVASQADPFGGDKTLKIIMIIL